MKRGNFDNKKVNPWKKKVLEEQTDPILPSLAHDDFGGSRAFFYF